MTEPTQTPLSQQSDWMETAERAERYAENAAYWRAKAKSATQRIAELESRVKQLEGALIRIRDLKTHVCGSAECIAEEALSPSPPAVERLEFTVGDRVMDKEDRACHIWTIDRMEGDVFCLRMQESHGGFSWCRRTAWQLRKCRDDTPPVQTEEKPATVPQSFNEWFNTKVPQEMRDAYLRSRMQMAWDAARAGTVPLAVAEGLDLSKCPVCGATSGIEKWNSEIVWCRSCHSRITNEWWMKLKSSNCRPDAQ